MYWHTASAEALCCATKISDVHFSRFLVMHVLSWGFDFFFLILGWVDLTKAWQHMCICQRYHKKMSNENLTWRNYCQNDSGSGKFFPECTRYGGRGNEPYFLVWFGEFDCQMLKKFKYMGLHLGYVQRYKLISTSGHTVWMSYRQRITSNNIVCLWNVYILICCSCWSLKHWKN